MGVRHLPGWGVVRASTLSGKDPVITILGFWARESLFLYLSLWCLFIPFVLFLEKSFLKCKNYSSPECRAEPGPELFLEGGRPSLLSAAWVPPQPPGPPPCGRLLSRRSGPGLSFF